MKVKRKYLKKLKMSKNEHDIIDKLLSELFKDKRENALNLVTGDYKTAAKKIITSHLEMIEDETEVPQA